MSIPMEDVVACLGFTQTDHPLSRAKDHPKIAHALAELAVEQGPDSITASQKEAAEQLMALVVAKGAEDQALAEAAAQLLAMTAANDKKNPHLMHVDRWVTTCCSVLKRCKGASDSKRRKSSSQANAGEADTAAAAAAAGGETGGTGGTGEAAAGEAVSEALLVCMASCLADLMNNPRSTIVCSTRAQEIFQCLQPALLLPRVSNRLLYFQVCRAVSEVLHPSTWPMNQSAAVPKRLLERLIDLITPVKASVAGGVKGADGSGDKDAGGNEADATAATGAAQNVAENGVGERETEATEPALPNGTAAADAEAAKVAGAEAATAAAVEEQEGGGSEGSSNEGDVTESLIHMQACKALLVMATNGAADLIVQHVPGVMGALERLRQESGVEEAVVQADAALMALWLSPKGYSLSNPELRPVVAAHLLRVLGSPDLVDNHQDVSLALVTSTINPDAATRASMLQLYAGLLSQQQELTHILIGHVDDTDSLAHQSVVYFVLHLCESEDCAKAFTANQVDCEALVAALVVAAQAENHYAPIAVLVRLASRPTTWDQVLTHIDTRTLNRLRAIPGTRPRREVDQLAAAYAEYKGEKPPERTASMPSEEEQSKEDILRDIVRSQSHRSLKSRTAGDKSFEDLAGAVASAATGVAKITVEESTDA